MLPIVTGEFRLVADPELIFGKEGTPICKFRLVANSRKKEGENWVDDKVVWLRGVTFNRLANHVAGTFSKGDLALVSGRLQTESWENDEGQKREAFTVLVDTMGPSLAFVEATMKRQDDKGTPATNKAADPWGSTSTDEPPF